ncbi:MAG TPA: helix-hairpin-helix domain-containing protein [Solirubrobacterales bacterium]|nr:helix-hairpin-helix domain-containing protein [Solirubrobacterales bacterium]
MKPRKLILLALLVAVVLGPGTAVAADEPTTTTAVPTTSSDASTDTAPLTLDQDQINALTEQANGADNDKSVFEKASDFVTDNAPWFIIGIIVLAAIIAGILIMRGRPRKGATQGTPKASKSNKAMRSAGGLSPAEVASSPAQTPSPSELRRRKRAAIQRFREEERARRKAGIENRKAARRGEAPAPVSPATASAAGVTAVTAAGVAAAGGMDPVEAEKQGARDQEVAAGAMARYGAVQAPAAPAETVPAPAFTSGQAIPAPVSPSQTAPAAGVVTPDSVPPAGPGTYESPVPEPVTEPVSEYAAEPAGGYAPEVAETAPAAFAADDTVYEPAAATPEAEAETSIIHEPSLENPGADAAVGNAAEAFLAGGAAGAAGGLAAARASRPEEPAAEPVEPLEPVIAPEPGMAPEHALADEAPVSPVAGQQAPDAATAAAEERLRAKVAEIKATQEPPAPPPPVEPPAAGIAPEPVPPREGLPGTEISPGLAAVERRLSENSEERDRAIRDAEERLRRVEQRAEDAERRAAFAERLAQLKVEESEREKRLNDVVNGIDRAEQRAREAEARAAAAEQAAAAALEHSDLSPEPVSAPEPAAPAPVAPTPEPSAPAPGPPLAEPYGVAPSAPEPVSEPAAPEPVFPEPVSAPAPAADEPPAPSRKGLFGGSAPAATGGASDVVNLNTATFEELREAGLSVTQATRILAYRERFGGYGSVEDLEKVPGFPADLIESLQGRITI